MIDEQKQEPRRVEGLEPDTVLTFATIFSFVATALAGIYLLTRAGFDSNLAAVLKALGLSYFLLFFPSACRRLVTARFGSDAPWWADLEAVFLLPGIAVLALLGVLTPFLNLGLFILVPACGFVLGAWSWYRFVRVSSAWTWPLFAVGVVIFSLWSASTYYGGRDPLFLERLMVTGETTIDTLFHASILNMIKTYGVVSTGVDGLVFVAYHFGSHWLFAQLSTLLRIDAISFYLIGFQVVFVPLFLYSIILFGLTVRGIVGRPILAGNIRRNVWLWLVLCVSTVAFAYLDSISVTRNETIAQSESLCVSMILTFLTGSILLTVYRRLSVPRSRPDVSDRVFLCVLFPVLMGAIGLSKISTMTVIVVALGYVFLRLRLFDRRVYVLSFVVTVLVAFGVSSIFTEAAERMTVVPFHYLIQSVMPDEHLSKASKVLLFVVFRFFWVWVLFVAVCRRVGLGSLRSVKEAFRRRSTLGFEAALVLAVVGVGPGFLFELPRGSAGYFMAVQNWIALGIVLGYIADGEARPADSTALGAAKFRRGLKAAGAVSVWLVLVALLAWQALFPVGVFMKQHLKLRTDILTRGGGEALAQVFEVKSRESLAAKHYRQLASLVVSRYVLRDGDRYLTLAPGREICDFLQRLDALPITDKHRTALFIPRSNYLYWGGLQRNHYANNLPAAKLGDPIYGGGGPRLYCDIVPFLAPAVTGLVLLDGLPEAACKAELYGYPPYYAKGLSHAAAPLSTEDLTRRAWREGFSRLIVVDVEEGHLVEHEYRK